MGMRWRHPLVNEDMKRTFLYLAACAAVLGAGAVRGAVVRYELTIAEKVIAPAGKRVTALAINDSIPGPTLRFRVGDVARIRVHNRLPNLDIRVAPGLPPPQTLLAFRCVQWLGAPGWDSQPRTR